MKALESTEENRILALQLAVQVVGTMNTYDMILEVAANFEKFILGTYKPETAPSGA